MPENFRDTRASVPVVVPRSKKSAEKSLHRAVAVMAFFLSFGGHAAAYILIALLTTPILPTGSPGGADGSILDIAMVGGGTDELPVEGEEEDRPPPPAPPQEPAPAAPEIDRPRPPRERRPEPEPLTTPEPAEEPAPEPEASEASSPADGTGLDPERVARDAFIESLMEQHRGSGGAPGTGTSPDEQGGGSVGLGCPDPLAGTWQARRYRGDARDAWVVFTARLSGSGSSLSGTLTYRSWNGGPSQRRPPPCGPGVFDDTVFMRARGSIVGNQVRIDAVSFSRQSHCMDFGFGYNLDHFSGTVEGDRIDAVNNDGGMDIDEPYVFRRISCGD